ncbi:MAG: hypothetical protein ACOC22_00645 [bacterium]
MVADNTIQELLQEKLEVEYFEDMINTYGIEEGNYGNQDAL